VGSLEHAPIKLQANNIRGVVLNRFDSYEETSAQFEWRIPARYNIGVDACDKWADGSGRLAIVQESRDGASNVIRSMY
jgi:hypothetical protein